MLRMDGMLPEEKKLDQPNLGASRAVVLLYTTAAMARGEGWTKIIPALDSCNGTSITRKG